MSFIVCCCKKVNTFSQWAEQYRVLTHQMISKQALCKRITEGAAKFCQALLEDVIAKQTNKQMELSLFKKFEKVMVQDSTTLKLQDGLSASFPGNHSNGMQKAVARIQSVLDIKRMQFVHFSVSGFTRNDQAASPDIITHCSKNDLVIRDMGYFATSAFKKLISEGVYILSRLRFGVNIYDLKGKPIALRSLLRRGQKVDRIVLIGEKKLRFRLVILPVPAAVAAAKIRKAKNDRDHRLHHSKDYYRWLEFNIYITNVSNQIWSSCQVAKAYKVRWLIEIIFKSWKTGGLEMQELLHERCTTKERVKCCIYLLLAFITMFTSNLFLPALCKSIQKENKKAVSILKMMRWVCDNITEVFNLSIHKIINQSLIYCCYEKRKDRSNMILIALNCKP